MFTAPSTTLAPILIHSFHTATPWREGIIATDSIHGGGTKEYVACSDLLYWISEGLVAIVVHRFPTRPPPQGTPDAAANAYVAVAGVQLSHKQSIRTHTWLI